MVDRQRNGGRNGVTIENGVAVAWQQQRVCRHQHHQAASRRTGIKTSMAASNQRQPSKEKISWWHGVRVRHHGMVNQRVISKAGRNRRHHEQFFCGAYRAAGQRWA